MASNATMNATILPIASSLISSEENVLYPFSNLYPVAASMVGTAKKNENSAAALLVSFCCIPPMIDAALLNSKYRPA